MEELLLSKYVMANLQNRESYAHLRVGQPKGFTYEQPAPQNVRQLYLSTLPEADLVVRDPSSATIYEFGIWRPQTKLGQLLVYKELLRLTPGFRDLKEESIRMVLVQPQEDPVIEAIAKKYQVGYEVFPDPDVLYKIAARRGG